MGPGTASGGVTIEVAGEVLELRPDRSVYWPGERTLFVADVHLGKAATFRSFGLPVPTGTTDGTLDVLSRAIEETRVGRLVILGDLWHAKAGRTDEVVGKFLDWRERHDGVSMVLVEGNHDRRSGRLPNGSCVEEVAEPFGLGPFALRHYPEPSSSGYVLSGHLHPGAVLDGPGRQSMKLPCFWFGREVAVLPAFGDFTGCAAIRPARGDSVFVLADGRVCRV